MTTILLIRHGQTDWNLIKRSQGHLNIPLNALGRAQSELLAQRLASWPIRAIYSSDLRRAAETAEIVGRPLGLEPTLDRALRERHGGIFQGHTTAEIEQLYPDALHAFRQHGHPPAGGESNLALARRAVPALERIVAAHPEEMIALVTHGGTLRVLIAYLLGLPVGKKAPFKVSGNTGLTIAEFTASGRVISLLNDCCHLAPLADTLEAEEPAAEAPDDLGYAIG